MRTIVAAPVVLSLLAAVAASANAGIAAARQSSSIAHAAIEQGESPIPQEGAPGPTRPHGSATEPALRPMTRGMDPASHRPAACPGGPKRRECRKDDEGRRNAQSPPTSSST